MVAAAVHVSRTRARCAPYGDYLKFRASSNALLLLALHPERRREEVSGVALRRQRDVFRRTGRDDEPAAIAACRP